MTTGRQLTNFNAAAPISDGDQFYIAQGGVGAGVEKSAAASQIATYVQAPLANGTATDAGDPSTWTGNETFPASRGTGLLQTTLTKIAAWVIQTYQGFTQSGTGAVARTVQDELRDLSVKPKQFGAVGDGVTDDSAAINNALNYVYMKGGGTVDITGCRYFCASTIVVPQWTRLVGPYENIGEAVYQIDASNLGVDYSQFKSAIISSANPAIAIRGRHGAVRGIAIMSSVVTPVTTAAQCSAMVAQFAGVGVLVGYVNPTSDQYGKSADSYVGQNLILGFQTCYWNDYNERPTVELNKADGVNGFYFRRIYDVPSIRANECWPFTTGRVTNQLSSGAFRRSGVGFNYDDWADAHCNFAYGYTIGHRIGASNHVTLIDCGADNYKAYNDSTTVGIQVDSNSREVTLIRPKTSAQGNGINIAMTGALTDVGQFVHIIGGDAWGNIVNHINLQAGRLSLIGSQLAESPSGAGLNVSPTSGGVSLHGNIFDSVSTPISISGAALELSNIGSNQYLNCVNSTVNERRSYDGQIGSQFSTRYANDSIGIDTIYRKARGTAAVPLAAVAGDVPMNIIPQVWNGTAWVRVATIRATARETPSGTSNAGNLILSTVPVGSTAVVDQHMIDSTGNLIPATSGVQGLGGLDYSGAYRYYSNVYALNVTLKPAASVTPANNGEMTFQLTSNTSLAIKVKGSDGTVRSASLALA